ncbi:ABC transporter ATP-binding protein [Corynebacterium ammoniagenes]|uniref:Aliphatic sulfonates import ATP-binding protein SsuB n=2 Tax=Corynebacterium ammoniagenes TaxID=1697 RepID=A0AAV5GCI0_CORAM|nr:ABC transporter ATP-binding protein [Corynebacterium ammoniagenes]APT81649.1 sulfonate ABC transporter ATP-binding protein [Corynebacterium ammoniagenes DSM 20306]AQS72769.1 sulfonate ABC transporter ATP-binding protein [Corynebacterium ammoniagenes]EFG82172.1 ABC transporter, ATP-binding protein [Corynebacterium ammoniagenes DSM 20306]GJN43785.1 aliphatic sulfonates import ATP-binding protein SsuB [Corynebacterium ammoniagenes]
MTTQLQQHIDTPESTSASTTAAAHVQGLGKSFGHREVLTNINLSIQRGEVVALIGRSGSGKSTILKVLAGLIPDHSGSVKVAGYPAVAFQEPRLFPWLSVIDNVAAGLNRSDISGQQAREHASALLKEVGLEEFESSWPETLSGGQSQRVSLARALISNPELLLLDEPFGALDALTRITAQQLLLDTAASRNFGVLLVTHDVAEAVALADRVILLEDGHISHEITIELPKPRERNNPQFARYTAQLLRLLKVTS